MGRFGAMVLLLLWLLTLGAGPAQAAAPADGAGQDSGTLAERLISLPIEGLTRALDLLGLVDIQQLVFAQGQPLSGPVLDLVVRWYTQLMVVCFFLLAIVFAWHAAWLGKAASPAQRAQVKAGFGRWTLALGGACLALALVKILFALNNGLVSFAAAHATNFKVDAVTGTGSVLATAVINLGLAGLKLYFNLLYTIRLVFIVVLLAISPLVIWSLALRAVRGGFALWAAELFANIMMQASHALALAALVSLLAVGPTHTLLDRWFAKIIVITLVVPLGQFLRNLVNNWLYMVGIAEDHTGGLLGGLSRGWSNLGRMFGPGGGGVFPPPGRGDSGGNDYEIGGSPPDPGGLSGGGTPAGPEAGWEGAASSGPVPMGGGPATAPYGGTPPGGSGAPEAGPGGNPLPGMEGAGSGGGVGGLGSIPGSPWSGGSPSPGFGPREAGASGFGEPAPGRPPSLDSLPDWRGLGEGGELPPLDF